jgi:hypothetical protein
MFTCFPQKTQEQTNLGESRARSLNPRKNIRPEDIRQQLAKDAVEYERKDEFEEAK